MPKRLFDLLKKQKQLHNFVTYGVGQFFNLVTPLLVVPYIVSVCTEEGYGKIGVGLAISFFLMVFIDYGSDILGVKEVAVNRNNPEKLETLFTTIYTAKLFLLLIVLAVTCLLIFFVPYFNQEKRLFFFGLPVLVGQFINPTWFLQGMENFKWITFSNILSKVVYVAGIFWCIQQPSDYVYNNLFWGIGMILANSIAFIYLWKQYGFSFKKTQKSHITSYLKSNFSMFGSQIFVSLQMYFPIVLVSYFGNNTMAGQYKIIDQIIVIFRTYILLFFNFIFPRVCYLLETSKAEALQFWRKANGLNFGFTLLLLLLISGYSFEIVDYFNPLNVAHISNLLQIALLIPLLQSIGQPLKQLVLGWNKQKMYTHTTMFVTVITLLLIVLLTPRLNVLGVLTALIISEILVISVFMYAVKNKLFNSTS
ncbi:oligosaccharide flippase family protein [Flavobacterium sedimenticola]|uniref:Oligosaccharide flippase family protein n=1 Tax=Flavobacterium sedimenticola TaxID=3043286 RepID=A0ABT6XM11_9FLAO|nr:oligosaccharide flippase family protein [Flavobacterium sedimenticola]MDI9256111.1 oligosaccharide flippase family protein [Flavobacterium sedimenticola]